MFPYSKDHVVIKRDRMKIVAAGVLNYLQRKLEAKDSVIATLKFEIINSNKEIETTILQKSNSFNRNYYNMSCLCGILHEQAFLNTFAAGGLALKNTAGTTTPSGAYGAMYTGTFDVVTADNTKGIVIGTGVGAESMEDYILGTKIAEGVAAGQMNYGVTAFSSSWDGGTSKFASATQRTIMNNSAGSITVNEVGLIRESRWGSGASQHSPYLFIRDVPTPMVIVAGGGLTVTYTITYQY